MHRSKILRSRLHIAFVAEVVRLWLVSSIAPLQDLTISATHCFRSRSRETLVGLLDCTAPMHCSKILRSRLHIATVVSRTARCSLLNFHTFPLSYFPIIQPDGQSSARHG